MLKSFISIGCALGLTSLLTTPALAVSLSLTPTTQSVELGQPATVNLEISDLGAGTAPSLGAFDITLNYNSAILSFQSVNFGDPILGDQVDLSGQAPLFGTIGFNSSPPIINLFEVSWDTPQTLNTLQANHFILATLTFNSHQTGTSPLTFTNVILGDADGASLPTNLKNGSVTVNPPSVAVPEPTSILGSLTALTLASLTQLQRKHRFFRNNKQDNFRK